ncbi:MAG: NUDIX hydrolase [Streptobacillus sp.]
MSKPICEGFNFLKGKIKIHPTTGVKLEYLDKSNAVCIILFNNTLSKVLLVEQYRPGVDGNTFENVAGLIDLGENPVDAVKRELKEETGYSFEDISDFMEYKEGLPVSPGYTTEKLYFYAARLKSDNILPGKTNFDEGEDILSHWIDIDKVEDYVTDLKTLFSISYFLPKFKEVFNGND